MSPSIWFVRTGRALSFFSECATESGIRKKSSSYFQWVHYWGRGNQSLNHITIKSSSLSYMSYCEFSGIIASLPNIWHQQTGPATNVYFLWPSQFPRAKSDVSKSFCVKWSKTHPLFNENIAGCESLLASTSVLANQSFTSVVESGNSNESFWNRWYLDTGSLGSNFFLPPNDHVPLCCSQELHGVPVFTGNILHSVMLILMLISQVYGMKRMSSFDDCFSFSTFHEQLEY